MRLPFRHHAWLLAFAVLPFFVTGCGSGDAKETAEGLIEDRRYSEAQRVLQKYVERTPRDAEGKVLLGRAYSGAKNHTAALQQLDGALEIDPLNSEAIEWRSRAIREQANDLTRGGDLDGARTLIQGAIADLESRIADFPEPALLYVWIGNLRLLQFDTHLKDVLVLLRAAFEPIEVGPHQARLNGYIIAPPSAESARRSAFLNGLRQNPSFGGIPAVTREMVNAKTAFRQTIENLERALKSDPDLSTAARALATIYLQVGQIDDARKMCERLVAIEVDEDSPATLLDDRLQGQLLLANILERRKDPEGAVEQLEEAYASELLPQGRKREILHRLCFLLSDLGVDDPDQYEKLREVTRTLLSDNRLDMVGRIHEAIVAYHRDEDPRHAVVILNAYPRIGGRQYVPALETLARAHRDLGDYAAAILTLNRILEEDPELMTARALRAETYRMWGYRQEALAECRAILDSTPQNTVVQEILRRTYLGEIVKPDDPEIKTIAQAYEHLQRSQFDQGVRYQLARLLALDGQVERAVSELDKLVEAFPGNFIPHEVLGRLWLARGDMAAAKKEFGIVQQLGRNLPDGLVGQAECLLRESNYRDAYTRLNRALTIAPDVPSILLLMATNETRRGNAWRAIRYIKGDEKNEIASASELATPEQALDLACVNEEIRFSNALRREGETRTEMLERTLEAFEKLAKRNPDQMRPRVGVIRTLDALGREYNARSILYPTLDREAPLPSTQTLFEEDALVLYFEWLIENKRMREVFEILKATRDGSVPLRSRVRTALAEAQFDADHHEAAVALARGAARDLPMDVRVNSVLALDQLRRGSGDALKSLNKVVAVSPGDVEAYRLQAEALESRSSPQILKVYQRLLKLVPSDLDVVQKLGDLFLRRNQSASSSPKTRKYLQDNLETTNRVRFPARLLAIRITDSSDKEKARGAETVRLRVLSMYAAERIARELSPLTRAFDSAVFEMPKSTAARKAQIASNRVPAFLDRKERQILAGLLISQGAPKEALWTITRFDADESGSDEDFGELDLHLIAVALIDLGQLDEATQIVQDGLLTWPESDAMTSLAFALSLRSGDFAAARQWVVSFAPSDEREAFLHFLRLVEDRTPFDPLPGILLARTELFLRFPILWADAVREAKNLAQILPASPIPYLLWAQTLAKQGEITLAIRVLTQSMERSPDHVPTILTAVEVLRDQRNEKSLAEALRILSRGLDFNPDSPRLIYTRAQLQLKHDRSLRHKQPILRMLKRALQLLEDEGEGKTQLAEDIHLRIARILFEEESFAEAEKSYRAAGDIRPDRVETRLRVIDSILADDRPDLAVEEADRLVEAAPESPLAWLALARALQANERGEEAIAPLRTVLEQDPLNPDAYELLAKIAETDERAVSALEWYERVSLLDPSRFKALGRLAQTRLEALRQAQEQEAPISPEGQESLLRRAKDEFEQCLTALPAKAAGPRLEAVRGLLVCLHNLGEPKELLKTSNRHYKLVKNDPGSLLLIGRAYLALEQGEPAEETLEKLVEMAPENPRARYYYAEALRLRFDSPAARREYQRAVSLAQEGAEFPELAQAEQRLQSMRSKKRKN